jgi:hypothetical protein
MRVWRRLKKFAGLGESEFFWILAFLMERCKLETVNHWL